MQGKTHAVTGALTALSFAGYLHLSDMHTLLFAGCAIFGALLPDIDHPRSYIRQRTGLPGDIVGATMKHRGITHTLLILGVLAFFAIRFHPLYGLALAGGYASHLLTDAATQAGVKFFWPVWKRPIYVLPRGLRISTGGNIELVLYTIQFGVMLWQAYHVFLKAPGT